MKTVTICGSMRFAKEMQEIAYELEIHHGMNVLQCVCNAQGGPPAREEMEVLGQIHYKKIDLSDAIYVLDMDGKIGEATQREIEYARARGKEVIFHTEFVAQNQKDEPTVEALFLGTCACDFSPKLKTEYKDCFDKDARRASVLLFDDTYMIDCGPHALESLRIAGKDIAKITDIFISHIHYDHFTSGHIKAIAEGREKPLRLWVREGSVFDPIENVEIHWMKPYERYEVAPDVFFTGLIANHNEESTPQHLILEKDGKKIFYGCDGGWFLAPTYEHMKHQAFDLMVLDCTVGDRPENPLMAVHNNIPMIKMMMPTLRMEQMVTKKSRVFISHIAPMFHRSHAETCFIMKDSGVEVAYDGLAVRI